jgi:peptidoglycan L-alanyl-D-glutamate endopeptidase CwlK
VTFALSQRSLDNLVGVQPALVAVVQRAIQITRVDFGVIEGLRTQARQQELVNSGASQTMNSRHLTGHAVDLMAYVGTRASWELNLYDDIADAMKQAATELNTPIKWGGAWTVQDIRHWHGTMASAMNSYIDERRKQGRRPFLDGPHFELP